MHHRPSRHSIFSPGNLLMVQERDLRLLQALGSQGLNTLDGHRVFEAGCGGGYNLRLMLQWGAHPGDLAGIDLDEVAIARCRQSVPEIRAHQGDAASVPEKDASFDIALAFTVFSSVPAEDVSRAIGAELIRVTRPGGLIVLYDMRRTNPWNRSVHKVRREDVRRWFPGCRIVRSRSLTLIPQLARPIGRYAPWLYSVFAGLPPLRTHAMYVMQRPAGRVIDVDAFAPDAGVPHDDPPRDEIHRLTLPRPRLYP